MDSILKVTQWPGFESCRGWSSESAAIGAHYSIIVILMCLFNISNSAFETRRRERAATAAAVTAAAAAAVWTGKVTVI